MPIYEFYWDGGDESVLVEIEAEKKQVEKLLDEYRNSDEYYNIEDFMDFLSEKGIKARILEPDYSIYF